MARLPDEADEAAYEAMPIEEFGAAMLRGMGWSEGQVPPEFPCYSVVLVQAMWQRPRRTP